MGIRPCDGKTGTRVTIENSYGFRMTVLRPAMFYGSETLRAVEKIDVRIIVSSLLEHGLFGTGDDDDDDRLGYGNGRVF